MTSHVSRFPRKPSGFTASAFTLIELLVVISIMALLAAIALPTFNSFRPNAAAVASAQLLADVGRARQLAISQRTTVFMVFLPTLSTQPQFQGLVPTEQAKVAPILDKQLNSYALVALRSLGDQPGRPTIRYLSPWKTLPDGAYIPQWKFPVPPPTRSFSPLQYDPALTVRVHTNGATFPAFSIPVFLQTYKIPFPSVENSILPTKGPNGTQAYLWLPYIAFDYLGRLVDDSGNLQKPWIDNANYQDLPGLIPLAKGGVGYPRDATKAVILGSISINETPPGNGTNSFNIVNVDWLTGRPHAEHPELQ